MVCSNTGRIRSSKEFNDIINFIRAKYILAGKRPPSTRRITRAIAKRINPEDLIKNEFIPF